MAIEAAEISRGSVVVVRLPKDKARPAVVVRSDLLAELPYATILPITSELRPGISMRIEVTPLIGSGLRQPSQVMVDWPYTVRLSQMGEVIGRLSDETMRLVTRQLAVVLGIADGMRPSRRS